MPPCCNGGASTPPAASAVTTPSPTRTWPRRTTALIQWALPITTLVLVPKCPACVAAYILLLTGIGLSIPAAAAVRWGLIIACITALAFLFTKLAMRIAKRGATPT